MAPTYCFRQRCSERNDVLGRGGGTSESVPLCLPGACLLPVRFVLTQPQMDRVPDIPVIDARVFSDLQSLRGRKDLVVQRTAGYYEGGWEFPRGNQPYSYGTGIFCVKLTKNVAGFASLFGFFPQVLEKEVEVNELIRFNPVKPPPAKLFGFVPIPIPRPPPVISPGIKKEPKPVPGVRSVWLMSMSEIKAELQYVAQQHPVHARSRSVCTLTCAAVNSRRHTRDSLWIKCGRCAPVFISCFCCMARQRLLRNSNSSNAAPLLSEA